jgi:acetolactate synthase-1/2/3 large subunit
VKHSNKYLKANIKKLLAQKGPLLCDVLLQEDYIFTPKLSSKKLPDGTIASPSLEDMLPFLDRKELESNILK